MNLFVTNPNPRLSAIVLPDKHIVKMPLEACQVVSTVFSERGWTPLTRIDGEPYKPTHKNHPVCLWAGEAPGNLAWIIDHALWLCTEFEERFNKEHGCRNATLEACKRFIQNTHPDYRKKRTPFVFCGPPEISRNTQNIHEAYKVYLNTKPWVRTDYNLKPERKPNWIN